MASGDTRKVILKNTDDEILIPYTEVASSTTAGRVKPDGTTTSVDSTGGMSVIGKQDTISSSNPLSADLITSGTTNKVVTQTEKDIWNEKQAALTFDTTPVSGSTNPVTSGGIYNAIQNIDALPSQTGQSGKFLTTNGTSASWDMPVAQAAFANITGQPSDNTNLATALNAKANDSDVVKLTGNQTISGEKILTTRLVLKDTQNALSENASTNTYTDVLINDKNNIPLGIWEYRHLTGNGSGMSMVLRKRGSESSAVWSRIGIFQDTSGNFYTEAPTPATADNSTKIATTAYVKNQGYIGSANLATCHVVTETYVNGTSWYRVYDDGWVEQGGRVSSSSQTVYFLKEFANTNYTVTGGLIPGTTSASYEHLNIGSLTTTSFYYTAYDSYQLMWYACGYGA